MADEPMPIEKAPLRVQREYYRRERRNNVIAILVLVLLALGGAALVWRVIS